MRAVVPANRLSQAPARILRSSRMLTSINRGYQSRMILGNDSDATRIAKQTFHGRRDAHMGLAMNNNSASRKWSRISKAAACTRKKSFELGCTFMGSCELYGDLVLCFIPLLTRERWCRLVSNRRQILWSYGAIDRRPRLRHVWVLVIRTTSRYDMIRWKGFIGRSPSIYLGKEVLILSLGHRFITPCSSFVLCYILRDRITLALPRSIGGTL